MNRITFPAVLGIMFCVSAFGAVFMELTLNPEAISAGESFEIEFVLMTDTERIGGVSYQLQVDESAGSGLFAITGRDVGDSPVSELTSTLAEVVALPDALLEPANGRDLGGLTAVEDGAAGPGRIFLSTVTVTADVAIAPGSYTFSLATVTAYDAEWPFDVHEVTGDSVTVTLTATPHDADQNGDWRIQLSPELTRLVQFYNSGGYHVKAGTEDGYAPGPGDQSGRPHDADQNGDWKIQLSPELTRLVQFYNSGGYHVKAGTEDGYAPGPAAP